MIMRLIFASKKLQLPSTWDVLASVTRSLFGVTASSSPWGDRVAGGYNVVRFLHLNHVKHTARRPLVISARGWTIEWVPVNALAGRMSSEADI
jgi:hypothetical protein